MKLPFFQRLAGLIGDFSRLGRRSPFVPPPPSQIPRCLFRTRVRLFFPPLPARERTVSVDVVFPLLNLSRRGETFLPFDEWSDDDRFLSASLPSPSLAVWFFFLIDDVKWDCGFSPRWRPACDPPFYLPGRRSSRFCLPLLAPLFYECGLHRVGFPPKRVQQIAEPSFGRHAPFLFLTTFFPLRYERQTPFSFLRVAACLSSVRLVDPGLFPPLSFELDFPPSSHWG